MGVGERLLYKILMPRSHLYQWYQTLWFLSSPGAFNVQPSLRTCGPDPYYWICGSWSCSPIRELIRDAYSRVPPWTYWMRMLILTRSPCDLYVHYNLRSSYFSSNIGQLATMGPNSVYPLELCSSFSLSGALTLQFARAPHMDGFINFHYLPGPS